MIYIDSFFLQLNRLENLEAMFNTGFYLNDLSIHDSSRDLVLVGKSLENNFKQN